MNKGRTLTIARALTRIKTIQAQLEDIAEKIGKYAAWNSEKRHPLGEMKGSLEKNHNQAKDEIQSLFQQFHDLKDQLIKLKNAVDQANLVTPITIGNQTMTINEALNYQRYIAQYVRMLASNYNAAVAKVGREVDAANQSLLSKDMDEDKRKAMMVQVLYLVPKERIKEIDAFLVEFMTELNGELNAVNAVTEILIEE